MKLVAMLRDNRYPNHRTLQRALKLLDSTCTFSISQKTIQRDVMFLWRVYHAPIGYDNGKRGYYLTDPTWRFEVPLLNPDEMQAVTLGARIAETVMPEPVAQKIQVATENLKDNFATGLDANALLISLVAKGARIPIEPAIFKVVFDAWQSQRGLEVTYSKAMSGEILKYGGINLKPPVFSRR